MSGLRVITQALFVIKVYNAIHSRGKAVNAFISDEMQTRYRSSGWKLEWFSFG